MKKPLVTYFSPEEMKQVVQLHDLSLDTFNRLYYRIYASELEVMKSSLKHSFDGRPFSYIEVKLLENMDNFAIKELLFQMFALHDIKNAQDVQILANHNVSRLVGLYQALVWKVILYKNIVQGVQYSNVLFETASVGKLLSGQYIQKFLL